MLIYAVSDIHSRIDRISIIYDVINQTHPDVLIVAGDITNYFNYSYVIEKLSSLPVPVLMVRGNSDFVKIERLFEKHSNLSHLHLKKTTLDSIDFVGLSGTLPLPFHSKICFNDNWVEEKIENLIDKDTVLVVHPPPYGYLDEVFGSFHAGSKRVNKVVSNFGPAILICGHIHERCGTAIFGKTHVVNCSIGQKGAGAIIKYEKNSLPIIEMLC